MNEYNPILNVVITEWITDKTKKTHTLTDIYQDDKINVAISKITDFLNNLYKTKDVIYIWKDDSIEFESTLLPDINPFKALKTSLPLNIEFNYKKGLFMFDNVNVVRSTNFPMDSIKPLYYISYIPKTFVRNSNIQNIIDTDPLDVVSVGISKVFYKGETFLKQSIKYLFDNFDKSNYDCLIRVYDNVRRRYKLKKIWMKTNIPLEKIHESVHTNECIIIVKTISNDSYYTVKIEDTGNVFLNIYMKTKDRNTVSKVLDIIADIRKLISDITSHDVILEEEYINCTIFYNKSKLKFKQFLSNLTKQGDFVSNIGKQSFIYKRTSKDSARYVDESSYIQSMINQGDITRIEIIQELKKYNPTKTDQELEDMIDGHINLNTGKPLNVSKIKYKTDQTILDFDYSLDNNILKMTVSNIPSVIQLSFLVFWISRFLNYNTKIIQEYIVDDKDEEEDEQIVVIQNRDDLRPVNLDLSSSSSGGGKIQIGILANLEPAKFDEKYARECQHTRQPVGMKTKDFQKYKDEVDNSISTKDNTYFCPRWWCLDDGIPLKTKRKCPNNDDPVNLFQHHSTKLKTDNTPKYIGFTKNKKLCCFTSNNKTINIEKSNDDVNLKEDQIINNINFDNILGNMLLVPPHRYGKIPKEIHDFYLKDINYENCNISLKRDKCMYREGVEDHTIVGNICHLLNISKNQFIKTIKKKMDFYMFMSLENGEVAREFMKTTTSVIYNHLPGFFPDNVVMDNSIKDKIFNAFVSYTEYLTYYSTTPQYLYSLLAVLFNKVLYVWNINNNDVLTFVCPSYMSYKDLMGLTKENGSHESIVLLNNNGDYEPIILKSKTERLKFINLSDNQKTLTTFKICTESINIDVYNSLNMFLGWINNMSNAEYSFDTLLINNNLSLSTIKLKNGLYLQFKPLSSVVIQYFLKDHPTLKVGMYDEFYYMKDEKSTKIDKDIQHKAKDFGFEIVSKINIVLHENAVLFYNTIDMINEKIITKTFRAISKYIYENIDLTHKKYDIELINKFSESIKDQDKKKTKLRILKLLLKELKQFDNNLDRWYSFTDIDQFLDTSIIDDGDQWIFSGNYLNNGIPDMLKNVNNEIVVLKNLLENPNDNKSKIDVNKRDDFMIGKDESLPNKWKPYKLRYVSNKKGNLLSFFSYLITLVKSNITIEDIDKKKKSLFKRSLGNKELLKVILTLNIYKKYITDCLKTKIDSNDLIINKIFEDRESFYDEAIKNLPIGHYDINAVSLLLNISFIIIRKRAMNHKVIKTKRNDIDDVAGTCDPYFSNNYEKNYIVFLYTDGSHYHYINMYPNITVVPSDLKVLLTKLFNAKKGGSIYT